MNKGILVTRLLCILFWLPLSLAPLSAQSLSEEDSTLYPENLADILSKIDAVRAPKSEGLIFVRVWVNEQHKYERMEVLASTNIELATWVKQYIPLINWHADEPAQSWQDLRLEFEPIPEDTMPLVSELKRMQLRSWEPTLPETIGPQIAHEPYRLPYIGIDDSELTRLDYAFSAPDLSQGFSHKVEVSMLPVPERFFPYIPLETEALEVLERKPYQEEFTIAQLESPDPILLTLIPLQFNYIPLDCDELRMINKKLSFVQSCGAELFLPEVPTLRFDPYVLPYFALVTDGITYLSKKEWSQSSELSKAVVLPIARSLERQPYKPAYVSIDCSELSAVSTNLVQPFSMGQIVIPVQEEALLLKNPEWKPAYISLDTEDLVFVGAKLEEPDLVAELDANQAPEYRAPAFVHFQIFDPIDTRGLKPLLKSYGRMSAPRLQAPVFKVELPEFRFRTYLDTEELQALSFELSTSESLSPEIVQRFDWRPEIPVSQLRIIDLEREVSIPCMPEIAIFPQNMQDILDRIPYPESARKLALEGEVRFKIWLDEDGRYLKHEVMESLPYLTRLCEYLLPDVEYLPVLLHGNPVPFQTEITFYFDMNRGNPSQCHYQDTRVTDDEFSY